MSRILGISCFYHDSAAAVLADGEIVAAAQEERFTRKKHDPAFPRQAVAYCLSEVVDQVRAERRNALPEGYDSYGWREKLYHLRSDIPAVTHIDFSARLQTVHQETNPRYWRLLRAFKDRTGYSVLCNTSFNVRGEPIVCTPEDAYRCFMRTEMDYLVMGDFLFVKSQQPRWPEEDDWRKAVGVD